MVSGSGVLRYITLVSAKIMFEFSPCYFGHECIPFTFIIFVGYLTVLIYILCSGGIQGDPGQRMCVPEEQGRRGGACHSLPQNGTRQ